MEPPYKPSVPAVLRPIKLVDVIDLERHEAQFHPTALSLFKER